MTADSLSGLPVAVQLFLYAIIGFGIAGGVITSYFRTAAREKNGAGGMVLAGDAKAINALTLAVDRLCSSLDRVDDSLQRSTDAIRDGTEATHKVRSAMLADKAMPPTEELLVLLKSIDKSLRGRGEDKTL
ncbi:MAG: hypothetical protein ACJ8DZ_14005 [Allosphingosinicella sp.]